MRRFPAIALCVGLLALFAIVSGASVLTKSATADEPSQAVAGWERLHRGDFRMDLSNPPLWNEWAALATGPDALRLDGEAALWNGMLAHPALEQAFAARALYATPGVDGAAFVNRCRLMMLAFGLLLGVLVAGWAWQLAGPRAAVVAVAFFALDPNFLAHAPLVKNDVAASAVLFSAAFFLWRAGRRLTWIDAGALCLLAGIGPNLKLSCLGFAPVGALLLGMRVADRRPWPALGRVLERRGAKAAAAGTLAIAMLVSFWAVTWASYDFRFSGARGPGAHLDHGALTELIRTHQLEAHPGDAAAWHPDATTRALLKALDRELLPEGFLVGLGHVYANAYAWPTFLLDRLRPSAPWYYFPLALLFKTPLTTLVAIAVAALAGIAFWRRRARGPREWWAAACVLLPPLTYFALSLRSRLGIGMRFELPVYPFAYVCLGVVADAAMREWRRRAVAGAAGIVAALALESLTAAPNFLCFFNAAIGGPRNGLHLLGDSNLDWGQDLPALARWQRAHPKAKLYLSYFGMADPAFYGIRYRALPGNYVFGPPPGKAPIQTPAVVAISASNLQGIPMATDIGDTFAAFRTVEPRAVLNGTIYLYDLGTPAP